MARRQGQLSGDGRPGDGRPGPGRGGTLGRALDRGARVVVLALIYLYQGVASVFPKVCRFEPSCSHYGLEAVRVHGALAGGWLTLKRILRCRPGGGFGLDPVPPAGCAHAQTGPTRGRSTADAHDARG